MAFFGRKFSTTHPQPRAAARSGDRHHAIRGSKHLKERFSLGLGGRLAGRAGIPMCSTRRRTQRWSGRGCLLVCMVRTVRGGQGPVPNGDKQLAPAGLPRPYPARKIDSTTQICGEKLPSGARRAREAARPGHQRAGENPAESMSRRASGIVRKASLFQIFTPGSSRGSSPPEKRARGQGGKGAQCRENAGKLLGAEKLGPKSCLGLRPHR